MAFAKAYLSLRALGIRIAMVYKHLWFKIYWKCWKIRLGFIKIKICLPWIKFYWTNWKNIFFFEFWFGMNFELPLLDEQYKFKLPELA